MSKEPTRAQLSSRLSYQAKTPAFLLRLQQNTLGGRGDDEDDEFEYDGSGRPPIPRRPAIPERPDDEPGSADEDDDEEGPQVVVLREGKHLSATEVENEKRKAKGLPPLPETSSGEIPGQGPSKESAAAAPKPSVTSQGLSFSSGATAKGKSTKRKAVGDGRDDSDKPKPSVKNSKKKSKKQDSKLLSFGDDA